MTPPLAPSVLVFNAPLPPWALVLLATAAAALAIRLYSGEKYAAGHRVVRLLAALRTMVVFVVAVMLIAPAYVLSSQHHSRGKLYLLLDDSRSMARVDTPGSQTRAALAAAALEKIKPTLEQFDVLPVPLSTAHLFATPSQTWLDTARTILDHAQAPSTPIGEALARIAVESDDPATLLLVSDGRQNQGPLPEPAARQLAAQGSRLFALSVGSAGVVRDAAVDSIDAPAFVLAGDDASISTSLRLDGIDQPVTATLTRDDRTIATRSVQPAPIIRVDFTDPAPPEGDHIYAVSIAPVPGEATSQNNRLTTRLTVRREKIRALLLDETPRWEYQFLKTLLQLDRAVELRSQLLQPARIETIPSPPPDPLPDSAQEWARFDVVILGDLSPARLTPMVQSELAAALRAGKPRALILIAGPRNLPARYAGSPLATLLPVDLTLPSPAPREGFLPHPTPEAETSALVRLLPDDQLNRSFWSAVPPFFWHAEYTTPKPAGKVIIETPGSSTSRPALLSAMTYGPGRVLYLATDETWRLRYVQAPDGQVADLHQRFWSQVIRWAVAGEPSTEDAASREVEDLNQSADPARLAALARSGNGVAFDVSQAARLAAALPNTDHVETRTARLGLFEDPQNPSTRYLHWAVLIIFIALLSAEWIIRKRRGLV